MARSQGHKSWSSSEVVTRLVLAVDELGLVGASSALTKPKSNRVKNLSEMYLHA